MRIASTPVKEIAALIGATLQGNEAAMVTGFNEIHRVSPGDCLFVDHPKYYDKALASAATTIIINQPVECPPGKCLLIHGEPFTAFNTLTKHFGSRSLSGTAISTSAKVGKTSVIMPGVFIGDNVIIGERCTIHPNVVVYDNCTIGSDVVIHAGSVIGSDGFYFRKRPGSFEPLYNCGTVVIEDRVVIGAGCTIDRGVTDVTRIGKGTILDNLVHVGHDVLIGELCLFAAQVGIAGAVTIGSRVTVWGQAGISSGITIGDGATILAQSGVGENVPPGATWFGTPAGPSKEKMREIFALKQLPALLKKLYDRG
jgi:UDP-3-O-[3-hydroxymyristoyl] glucosamine N-acyltransferase